MSTFIFGRQVRAARVLLGWSQNDLASRAGIGVATLKRFEASEPKSYGHVNTASKIENALESGGIIFITEDEENGPGIRLKKQDFSQK